MPQLIQRTELKTFYYTPVHCPFCGVRVMGADPIDETRITACPHTLFIAHDTAFEYRSARLDARPRARWHVGAAGRRQVAGRCARHRWLHRHDQPARCDQGRGLCARTVRVWLVLRLCADRIRRPGFARAPTCPRFGTEGARVGSLQSRCSMIDQPRACAWARRSASGRTATGSSAHSSSGRSLRESE